MSTVIDRLREEHRGIARLLRVLEHQVEVFERAERPDYDIVRGIADYFLDYPDQCHHPKEDAVFERLRARYPEQAARLEDLEKEHRDVHDHARRFHETVEALLGESDIARDAVVEAGRAFIDRQRRHMVMEEDRFFPLVEQTFGPTDWLRVGEHMEEHRDPLFDSHTEAKFADLRDRLLAWEEEYGQG